MAITETNSPPQGTLPAGPDAKTAINRPNFLRRLRDQTEQLRLLFGVRELAVFGSVARDEAHSASDVDMLVSFDGRADFDRFMGLKIFLEDLLQTRVDLVTRQALRPELRKRIESEAIRVA
jgi:uncharacterized protein